MSPANGDGRPRDTEDVSCAERLLGDLAARFADVTRSLAAFASVVLLGTLKGIVVAVVASLAAIACQSAHPRVYVLGRKPGADVFRPKSDEHPEDETFPGLPIVRPEGRTFFANANAAVSSSGRCSRYLNPRSWRSTSALGRTSSTRHSRC